MALDLALIINTTIKKLINKQRFFPANPIIASRGILLYSQGDALAFRVDATFGVYSELLEFYRSLNEYFYFGFLWRRKNFGIE